MNSGEWLFNSSYSRNNKKKVDYYFLKPGGLYELHLYFFESLLLPETAANPLLDDNRKSVNCGDTEFPPRRDMKLLKDFMRDMISAPLCLLSPSRGP